MPPLHESLSKRAGYHRRILSQFANRWKNEYLLSLLEACRPKQNRKEPNINIGDILILRNQQEERVFWKMCRVLEPFKGKDGIVRAAKVQVVTTEGKRKVFNRALKYLIPLEINILDNSSSECCRNMQDATQATAPARNATKQAPAQTARLPKRTPAVIAIMKRRDRW